MRYRALVLAVTLLGVRAVLAADVHHVRLLIRDGGKPAPHVLVVVRYPDGAHTNGAGFTLSADEAGVAEFAIPANSFWLTIRELNPGYIGKEFVLPDTAGPVTIEVSPREWRREERRK